MTNRPNQTEKKYQGWKTKIIKKIKEPGNSKLQISIIITPKSSEYILYIQTESLE